jgi:hypothetical protein
LNYLSDEPSIWRALLSIAEALRPEGVLAIDLCDVEWAAARRDAPGFGQVEHDWAIVTQYAVPSPSRFVREITTFLRNEDGSWRRDDERHDNVLIDTGLVPPFLQENGIEAAVEASFGEERLPVGLRAVVGHKRP